MTTKRPRRRERSDSTTDDLLAELATEGIELEGLRLEYCAAGWRACVAGEPRAVWASPEQALRELLNEVQIHGRGAVEHSVRRSCLRKQAYHDRGHAEQVRRGIAEDSGLWLRLYECGECRCWHLTKRELAQ